jgi:succinyl-CoA synthetase beta subunit
LFNGILIRSFFRLIKESGLKIYSYDDLDEAAAKAVELGNAGKST